MYLKKIHRQVQETTRQFANDVIKPQVSELDQKQTFPNDIYQEMAKLGLLGITVPEKNGGPGFDTLTYTIVMEELAKGYASVADQCGLVELVSTLLVQHGTESQRKKWLKDVLNMKTKVAYCITEPEAGTDVANIKTHAEHNGKNWVISGEKIWIHNAPIADVGFVLAKTDKKKGHKGMSIFVVDLNQKGVTRSNKENKMGQRASQVGAINFDDTNVPDQNVIGEIGQGFYIMMSVLNKGRAGIAALAVGIAQAGLEAALEYAKNRKQFEKNIAEFQGIQWMLADMAKDISAARLLVHNAATKIDQGLNPTMECSIAKCFASDVAVRRTADAVQVFGGAGYITGFEVERLYRDAKITQIYEGTNQIQRTIIARELIKNGAET